MSWTCECTESTKFTVKNPKQVKQVLTDIGFEVYEDEKGLCFFSDEGAYIDDYCEVVLTKKDKTYIAIGIPQFDNGKYLDRIEELGLGDDDVEIVNIYSYLQDQLTEGSYILITNAGYEERSSGKFSPFGSVEIITKTTQDGYSLYHLSEKLVEKHVKRRTKMKVTKVVYAERDNVRDEDYQYLTDIDVIRETDYGTTEILAQDVQEHKDNVEVIECLNENFGTDVIEGLLKDEIDLIMIVYNR